MSRLASFKGPSSPSQSPVRAASGSTRESPRASETTYHRKIRTLLRELRAIAQVWDELMLVDGLKAVQSLIDTRTELDNELISLPSKSLPPVGLVAPKIHLMEKRLMDLDLVFLKLEKQFNKMAAMVDNLESVVYEAHKTKGWKWVQEEPLWCTWTLEKFATNIPTLLPPYHRSLYQMKELALELRSHDVSFDRSREILSKWVARPQLQIGGWADWEEICSIEVEKWDSAR
ncbi:hypothetical protein K439DRAFT_1403467 [Ramaria rubella]|nr:hypothetical protein K439DRAFT_1403467 [Ramaria rubella]